MIGFIEANITKLTGVALDWAVAKVIDRKVEYEFETGCLWFESEEHEWLIWSPSTNWAHGGPILDKYGTALNQGDKGWWAHAGERLGEGDTPLVAICRAVVSAKVGGEVVMVPNELMRGSS